MHYKFFKLNTLLLTTSALFSSQYVFAGYEPICAPVIGHLDNVYTSCSNLPILTPSNDNQTNMVLLLSDMGLANIQPNKPDDKLNTAVYGITPFEADTLIFKNKIKNQRISNKEHSYSSDEHCGSVSSGADDFILHVKNNKSIAANEKQILIDERNKLKNCDQKAYANSGLTN